MNRAFKLFEKYPFLTFACFWALLFTVFYYKVLFDGNVFFLIDASRFFFPLWQWGAGVVHQGVIPLWNSDAQFGTPYLADPQMAYAYPPVFRFYSWFTPMHAFSALILFHHAWAVLGFWVWARGQNFSFKSTLFGSVAFGLSLHLVCSNWTPPALMTISWLPWVLACAERIHSRKPNGFLFLSLCWAMQLAAGYPVLVYLTGLALLAHLTWRSFQQNKFSFTWVIEVGLAALVAALYNLVWGLPFLEFLKNSNYQNGSSRVQDLDLSNLATFLYPFVSGHPLTGDYQGPDYWIATYFVGLPILCLLVWGLIGKVYRKNSPLLLVLFVVLSLGSLLKVGSWLKFVLPGYALVVHSGFWITLVLLWVIVLAMEALESFVAESKSINFNWWIVSLVVYGAALFVKTPLTSLLFWASLILLLLAQKFHDTHVKWLALMGALVLSLVPAALSLNQTMEPAYYEKPPEVLVQLHHSGRLFFSPVLMAQALRLEGNSLNEAYQGAKETAYPNWPLAYGRQEVPIYNTLQLADSFDWTFAAFQHSTQLSRKALNLLGIRYVFGPAHFDDLQDIESSSVKISENTKAFPLWFTVTQALPAGATANGDFIRADIAKLDYAKTCFIEDPTKAGGYSTRSVTEVGRGPNEVALLAKGKGRALIVSSETEAPGWCAWVNGEKRPVEKVNHAFRGIVLGEGEEKVLMQYQPLSFRLGLFLCLLTIGLWLIVGLKRFF